jgi:hypothetical protein
MTRLPALLSLSLCRTFADQSAKIWDDLMMAQMSGRVWDEETITNILLRDVERAHPQDVATFQFKKPQEKVTGADWEWWLTDGRLWLGLLIQAKRLDPESYRYRGIKHRVGTDQIPQIDLLLRWADFKGIDPLYLFYNYSNTRLHALNWNCGSMDPDLEQLGCTIAHAGAVKRVLSYGGAGLPKMSTVSYPLRCLVCCPMLADPDDSLPGRAHGITKSLRGLLSDRDDHVDPVGPRPPGIRDEPPAYVQRLLAASLDERGPIIEEVRSQVGPISALVVIKERRERS